MMNDNEVISSFSELIMIQFHQSSFDIFLIDLIYRK